LSLQALSRERGSRVSCENRNPDSYISVRLRRTAFAGVTAFQTFYESITLVYRRILEAYSKNPYFNVNAEYYIRLFLSTSY